jgi:hypothetical protein
MPSRPWQRPVDLDSGEDAPRRDGGAPASLSRRPQTCLTGTNRSRLWDTDSDEEVMDPGPGGWVYLTGR